MSNKRTIPYGDYLKVVGLLTLAREHNKAIETITRSIAGMLDEPEDAGYFGVVSDEVVDSNPDADGLLRRMDIEVEPQADAVA